MPVATRRGRAMAQAAINGDMVVDTDSNTGDASVGGYRYETECEDQKDDVGGRQYGGNGISTLGNRQQQNASLHDYNELAEDDGGNGQDNNDDETDDCPELEKCDLQAVPSSEDTRSEGELESIRYEIFELEAETQVGKRYKIVDRLGEGTRGSSPHNCSN